MLADACCCVVWNRQLLDCLLAKDAFINAVMSNLIGRDVTDKAYQTMVTVNVISSHLI